MSMTKRLHRWLPGLAAFVSLAAPAGCRQDDAPATPPTAAASASKPAPPPFPIGAPAAAEEHVPDAGQPSEAIVPPGAWAESKTYKFRLDRIAPCGAATPALGPAQPTAAGTSGQLRGETSWVGAFFAVEAKEPSVFVTSRDLELRRGGVILTAHHINQPLLQGCQPVLAAKQLRAGESLSGFALFEVPKSFRTKTEDPIVLSYRPTRWGGARRVDVPVRECLDACGEPSVSRTAKTAGRSPSRR